MQLVHSGQLRAALQGSTGQSLQGSPAGWDSAGGTGGRAPGVAGGPGGCRGCTGSRFSSRKQLNPLLSTVLMLRGKLPCVKERWFLRWWACWKTHSPKFKSTQQERWCLPLLRLRVRDTGNSVGYLLEIQFSGYSVTKRLPSLLPKPSVSDSDNARQETLRFLHNYSTTVASSQCHGGTG